MLSSILVCYWMVICFSQLFLCTRMQHTEESLENPTLSSINPVIQIMNKTRNAAGPMQSISNPSSE